MKTSHPSLLRQSALLALGCVLALVLVPVQSLKAADSVTLQPLADAKALPLSHTLKKVEGGEKGPFVLTLKNDSHADVTVTGKVLLAIFMHADPKARHLPAQKIEAGKTWSIDDLVAEDKVVLTADGFEPLTIVVK